MSEPIDQLRTEIELAEQAPAESEVEAPEVETVEAPPNTAVTPPGGNDDVPAVVPTLTLHGNADATS